MIDLLGTLLLHCFCTSEPYIDLLQYIYLSPAIIVALFPTYPLQYPPYYMKYNTVSVICMMDSPGKSFFFLFFFIIYSLKKTAQLYWFMYKSVFMDFFYAFFYYFGSFQKFVLMLMNRRMRERERSGMRKQERERERDAVFFLIYILKLCIHSFVCLLSRILLLHFFFIVIEHENTMLCCTSRNCFCCLYIIPQLLFRTKSSKRFIFNCTIIFKCHNVVPYWVFFLYFFILYECYNLHHLSLTEQFFGAETYIEHYMFVQNRSITRIVGMHKTETHKKALFFCYLCLALNRIYKKVEIPDNGHVCKMYKFLHFFFYLNCNIEHTTYMCTLSSFFCVCLWLEAMQMKHCYFVAFLYFFFHFQIQQLFSHVLVYLFFHSFDGVLLTIHCKLFFVQRHEK